jgi:hypothetical protein
MENGVYDWQSTRDLITSRQPFLRCIPEYDLFLLKKKE